MRLCDITNESFDSDVKGRLVRATNDLFTTEAIIGNRKIVFNAVAFDPESDSAWEIEFIEKTPGNTTYGKSGSGNEMQVFSFVIESIKELVARYHPKELVFSSHKADGNRSSLYKRIAGRVKIPGYHLADIDANDYSDIFKIVRDDK